MVCFDGNNSLKRLASTEDKQEGDTREYHSDYYLSRQEVDQYAHEVKARQRQPKPDLIDPEGEDDAQNLDGGAGEGDPTDGADNLAVPCADHWKAAAADNKKTLSGNLFDETGWFVCACRHGMILWVADMIRSGELYVGASSKCASPLMIVS